MPTGRCAGAASPPGCDRGLSDCAAERPGHDARLPASRTSSVRRAAITASDLRPAEARAPIRRAQALSAPLRRSSTAELVWWTGVVTSVRQGLAPALFRLSAQPAARARRAAPAAHPEASGLRGFPDRARWPVPPGVLLWRDRSF